MPVSVQVGSRSLFCPTAAAAVEVQSQPVGGEDANPEFSADLWSQRLVMRKRIPLRSPVRENRTPGSVRGASGNWRSYLDGAAKLKRKNGKKSAKYS